MIKWEHSIFALPFALCGAMLAAGGIPAGRQLAWIAVRGSLDPRILLLTAAVTCWVAGFDVLYACQDFDFDISHRLYSIPRALGIPRALLVARGLHLLTLVMLLGVLWVFDLGRLAAVGVVLVALLLRYEHSLVRADDLSKLDATFFTMNGCI